MTPATEPKRLSGSGNEGVLEKLRIRHMEYDACKRHWQGECSAGMRYGQMACRVCGLRDGTLEWCFGMVWEWLSGMVGPWHPMRWSGNGFRGWYESGRNASHGAQLMPRGSSKDASCDSCVPQRFKESASSSAGGIRLRPRHTVLALLRVLPAAAPVGARLFSSYSRD